MKKLIKDILESSHLHYKWEDVTAVEYQSVKNEDTIIVTCKHKGVVLRDSATITLWDALVYLNTKS